MADDNCACKGPNIPSRRPRPRMGVSSLNTPQQQPLRRPIPPRSVSPRRVPRTVPGLSRVPCPSSMDRTLSPGSADRTLTGNVTRPPDFTNFEEAMEELSKLEFVEQRNVEDDLNDFQKKRRKLVYNMIALKMSKAKKSVQKAVSKMGI